ncbi:MAG: hypothetical protein KJO54_04795 [Gammaproteobacteria bacterium]|nr:hypothetical protein [Gammaproteobacteria bacterium]NNF60656.1 hypothetical protein [Gammaproteobacteria bacterium]
MRLWKSKLRGFFQGLIVTGLSALFVSGAALAAPNQGTGDVAGDGAALVDSNVFNLLSTGAALTLVKRAFLADGTPITTGSTLPTGTVVKFMIYVNNTSSIQISDVSMRDVLDPLFLYQAGTIKVDNSVAKCAAVACTPAEEATIFAAADGSAALSDAVDADVASIAGVTVDAGNQNVANAQMNAAADSVLALVFSVRMQ